MSKQNQPLPPPLPPDTPDRPRLPQHSRYNRPRRLFSIWGLFIGLVIGISGGLYYAWNIAPVEEFDTAPRQLRESDKAHYAVAIVLDFIHTGDLTTAVDRLVQLLPGSDPFQEVAEITCDLARTGYVDSSSGLRAVRYLKTFYQLQGRSGCADTLIPDVEAPQVVEITVPTATPTLPPPPSKTPLPEQTIPATPTPDASAFTPTPRPQREYEGRVVATFCDTQISGVIEVFVQRANGDGVPGERVRVRWDDGEDVFVTGLKPERGAAYADFQMEAGTGYIIDMPGGRADAIRSPLVADRCVTEDGQEALTTYQVVFRQIN